MTTEYGAEFVLSLHLKHFVLLFLKKKNMVLLK